MCQTIIMICVMALLLCVKTSAFGIHSRQKRVDANSARVRAGGGSLKLQMKLMEGSFSSRKSEKVKKRLFSLLLSTENNNNGTHTYKSFDGAEDLIVMKRDSSNDDDERGGDMFQPAILTEASPEQMWKYWQNKKKAHQILKSAIASAKPDIRPEFEKVKPFLLQEKADVLATNANFFAAVAQADTAAMQFLWHDSNDTVCMIGGRDAVHNGYKNITNMWTEALANRPPNFIRHQLTDVDLFFMGDMAVVTCTLHTSSGDGVVQKLQRDGKKASSSAFVTNIFIRPPHSDRYFLSTHIASLTPGSISSSNTVNALKQVYRDPTRPRKKTSTGPLSIQQLLGGLSSGPSKGQGNWNRNSGEDDDEEGEEVNGGEEEGQREGGEYDDEESPDIEVTALEGGAATGTTASLFRDAILKSLGNLGPKSGPGGGGKANARVYVMGKNGETTELTGVSNSLNSLNSMNGGSGSSAGADDDDDDDEDDDVESNLLAKELASRTLLAVRHLYAQQRITKSDKNHITIDIIQNAREGNFSKAEVAFSLLIGSGRPEDEYGTMLGQAFDISTVDEGDMQEFLDVLLELFPDSDSS